MNKCAHLFLGVAVGLALAPSQSLSGTTQAHALSSLTPAITTAFQARNTISGHIFGPSHRPVSDIYVELLNEVYSSIGRTKTDGSGRYVFNNLSSGTFKVRVLPYGTDFMEQTQEVSIVNVSVVAGGGTDFVQLDFYLKPRKDPDTGPLGHPGAIFVQEVPDEAKKFYEKGIEALDKKREKEGFENLKRSLEIFPNYYMALDRLGTEYVVRGHYEAAYILLLKAVEVNPRGYTSMLGLGLAQYHLKRIDDAIETLRRATTLYNKSINANLWLGIALKQVGKLDQAEVALKRAKEMSKDKAPEVHWQLAQIYSDQKHYKEAADELEQYLKTQHKERDPEKITQLIKQLREKAATR